MYVVQPYRNNYRVVYKDIKEINLTGYTIVFDDNRRIPPESFLKISMHKQLQQLTVTMCPTCSPTGIKLFYNIPFISQSSIRMLSEITNRARDDKDTVYFVYIPVLTYGVLTHVNYQVPENVKIGVVVNRHRGKNLAKAYTISKLNIFAYLKNYLQLPLTRVYDAYFYNRTHHEVFQDNFYLPRSTQWDVDWFVEEEKLYIEQQKRYVSVLHSYTRLSPLSKSELQKLSEYYKNHPQSLGVVYASLIVSTTIYKEFSYDNIPHNLIIGAVPRDKMLQVGVGVFLDPRAYKSHVFLFDEDEQNDKGYDIN